MDPFTRDLIGGAVLLDAQLADVRRVRGSELVLSTAGVPISTVVRHPSSTS